MVRFAFWVLFLSSGQAEFNQQIDYLFLRIGYFYEFAVNRNSFKFFQFLPLLNELLLLFSRERRLARAMFDIVQSVEFPIEF